MLTQLAMQSDAGRALVQLPMVLDGELEPVSGVVLGISIGELCGGGPSLTGGELQSLMQGRWNLGRSGTCGSENPT